jgi:serine/threonine-protein kinase
MAEPAELRPGLVTRGYRIERALGHGGMGQVWEATQLSLDRRVALKVIADDVAADPGFEQRFRFEAQMAARVTHDAVLPVYDHGALDDGRLYLAMKLINGPDLSAVLAQRGALPLREAVSLLVPIAEALEAAHECDLIHRDVKPSNVLLEPHKGGWRPYLADFGLAKPRSDGAKHTRTGKVVGTADFMAPEQARGDRTIDGRVDVYAFGCLLYRTITGENPYPRDTENATMLAHVNDAPPVPSRLVPALPRAVDRVVQRAMEKDVDRRAHSAAALMRWLDGQITPAQRTVAPGDADPTRRVLSFGTRFAIDLAILAPAFALAYLIGANL